MTVIAYDTKFLAVDRKISHPNETPYGVTKLFYVEEGSTKIQPWTEKAYSCKVKYLMSLCGEYAVGMRCMEWVAKEWQFDNDDEDYPDDDGDVEIIVLDRHSVFLFEGYATPLPNENDYVSMGSGGAFAHMAMYLGKSAKIAVKLTGELCASCGNGMDYVDLKKLWGRIHPNENYYLDQEIHKDLTKEKED